MRHLAARLAQLGSRLVLRRSPDSGAALRALVAETGATAVFFNHLYDSISMVRDQQIKDELRGAGVAVHTYNADLLYEPWQVLDDDGQVSSGGARQGEGVRGGAGGDSGERGFGLTLPLRGRQPHASPALSMRRRRRAGLRAAAPPLPMRQPPRLPTCQHTRRVQPFTTFKSYWDKCLSMPFPPPLPLPEPPGPLPAVPEEVASLQLNKVGQRVLDRSCGPGPAWWVLRGQGRQPTA